jgi:hypothetical protein
MFELIRQELEKEYQGYKNNTIKYLTSCENDDSLKRHSTNTRWTQYINGVIDREKAMNYALTRIEKDYNKKLNKEIEFLDRISTANDVENVSIFVQWHKSRTWGMNPTADIEVQTTTGKTYRATGTASGCGYDKLTAAIGSALNEIDSIRKMLCECKENALNNGVTSGNKYNPGNSAFIHYGAGYGAIPYFEGGVGMSSFEGVFNACNLKLTHQNNSKTTNYYFFTKGV